MPFDPVGRLDKTGLGRTYLEFKLCDNTIVMVLWQDGEIWQSYNWSRLQLVQEEFAFLFWALRILVPLSTVVSLAQAIRSSITRSVFQLVLTVVVRLHYAHWEQLISPLYFQEWKTYVISWNCISSSWVLRRRSTALRASVRWYWSNHSAHTFSGIFVNFLGTWSGFACVHPCGRLSEKSQLNWGVWLTWIWQNSLSHSTPSLAYLGLAGQGQIWQSRGSHKAKQASGFKQQH